MRILFFSNNSISPNFGGIERVTSLLTNEFEKRGIECYSAYINEIDSKFLRTKFNKTVRLSEDKNLFVQELIDFLNEIKIDIIINQDNARYCKEIYCSIQKSNMTIKTIFCHHISPGSEIINLHFEYYCSFFKRQNALFKNIVRLFLFPFHKLYYPYKYKKGYHSIYMYNNRIVLLSKYFISLWMDFANITKSDKFDAINNCLTFPYYFDMSEYKLKEKEVLIVSRLLEGHKNISISLKIWKLIEDNKDLNEWKLRIVGHGPDEEYYKRLAKSLNLQRVIFENSIDPAPFYRQASVFMMTSSYEGWPLTLNEAKQNGLVPIAFDSFASLKEIIKDEEDGFIIENNNILTFAEKLIQIVSDDSLREGMAVKAIANTTKFVPSNIADKWVQLFESLCH